MIVKMNKYDFVVFSGQKEDFLGKLQDLGLVDITTTGWEPDDRERDLMISIEKHRTAVERLRSMAAEPDFKPGKPYTDGEEAYDEYMKVSTEEDKLTAQIVLAEKEVEDLIVWGDFNPADIKALEQQGVVLRYFHAYTKEFEASLPEWSNEYNIVPISEDNGTTYFVVITEPGKDVLINAQELKAPAVTYSVKESEIEELSKKRDALAGELARTAASVNLIEEHGKAEEEKLHFSKAAYAGTEAAEGTLVLMEGWATAETSGKVDAMLKEYPNIFFVRSSPTPEDEVPVLLKNNKFNKMFEFIGNFYSLPKYGTMDLTPFFGPFYLLFFGLCLADAGYGLLFFLIGLLMRKKLKPSMKSVANLVISCGAATMICGTFLGSFFGLQFYEYGPFKAFGDYVISSDNMFYVALGIGVIQILFGMILKVVVISNSLGFKYALSTLGWMIVLVSSILAALMGNINPESAFVFGSVPYLICLGVGAFMMLFLNSPGKNPLANIGAGLWNTYNDVTGILGDVLSYIRLFAIGLSGGILASVFNQLALGLSPDVPGVRQISILLILLIGHGITFFMSVLSSFVHPMRLTFVEFYKNAGFEMSQREFTPLKRLGKEE